MTIKRSYIAFKALVLASIIPLSLAPIGCGKKAPPPEPDYQALEAVGEATVSTNFVRYDARPGSKMRIEGTSTVHDWQVESKLIGGFLEISDAFPTNAQPGQAIPVRGECFVPVRSLRSLTKEGNAYSTKMDDIMYEKLLAGEHPRVVFLVNGLTLKSSPTAEQTYECEGTGELVVAGVTNAVTLPISLGLLPENRLKVDGTLATKMTAFGITPPEPLGMLLKTGDDVKLIFTWTAAKRPETTDAGN